MDDTNRLRRRVERLERQVASLRQELDELSSKAGRNLIKLDLQSKEEGWTEEQIKAAEREIDRTEEAERSLRSRKSGELKLAEDRLADEQARLSEPETEDA